MVLQNFLPSALICIAVIAFFLWLRGEALLDAWAAVSDSRQQLLEETGKQRRALDALTRRHGHIVHFTERQVIRHWIGDQEDEDRTDYELTTTAASGQSVLWRTIHVRSDSKSSSFREIQFDISSVLPEDGFSIEFIPLSEKAGDLRGMAIFLPEIREDPRKWRYSHRWKGMWNPLRNNLRDNATYHLQVAGMISSIEIQFIFPADRTGSFILQPPEGAVRVTDTGGRHTLMWGMESPPLKPYQFILSMDPLRSQN